MSLAAMTWAFEQALPPNEKIVLLALSDCENGHSLVCIPGQERLMEMTSMSESTVRRMLKKLEADGYISRHQRRTKEGYRTSDSYTLHRTGKPTGQSDGQVPTGQSDRQSPTGQSDAAYRSTVTGTWEPEEEPEVNPPTPQGDGDDDGYSMMFTAFWDAYPRREGVDAAHRAYQHVIRNGASEEKLILSAQSYASSLKPGDFIYPPAAWLRGGHFKSGPAPLTPRAQPPRGRSVHDIPDL